MEKYNIFLVDNNGNHCYLKNIPSKFQPDAFLKDHGFKWEYYHIIENSAFVTTIYNYKNDQLLKINDKYNSD